MMPRPMSAIDDYLDRLAPDQKAALARMREIVAALVPDAKQGRSYGMPAFIYAGRPLLTSPARRLIQRSLSSARRSAAWRLKMWRSRS
jgi:uncharacterized protein YdhG (YjbR/CyaY superfamily)